MRSPRRKARIYAIAPVHKRLYSSGDVRYVALDEYLSALLEHLETSMRAEGHGASLQATSSSRCRLQTDASINLGVVVTEWVTNAFKYAYPDKPGEVRVRLKRCRDRQGRTDGRGRWRRPPRRRIGEGHRPRHPDRQGDGGDHAGGDRVSRARPGHGRAADLPAAGRDVKRIDDAFATHRWTGERADGRACSACASACSRWCSALCVAAAAAFAQDGPPGITAPTVFPPFDRDAPACSAPPGPAERSWPSRRTTSASSCRA